MQSKLGKSFKTAGHNLWNGLPLIISCASCLCLFLQFDPVRLILMSGIFLLVTTAVAMGMVDLKGQSQWIRVAAVFLAVLLDLYGLLTFTTAWAASKRAGIIASVLGLRRETVLYIIGGVGCVLGLYAFYVLCFIVVRAFWELLREHCPVRTAPEMARRLALNLPLPISAYAFLTIANVFPQGFQGVLIILLYCGIASQMPPLWSIIKKAGLPLNIFSAISALGIFCAGDFLYSNNWAKAFERWPFWAYYRPLRHAAAGASCFFLFLCVLVFWRMMAKLLTQAGVFRDISVGEHRLYAGMLLALLGLMALIFSRSYAFYGCDRFDIIYTGDSSALTKEYAFILLNHSENDIRQPLFAVFSAPFVGWVCFLAWLLHLSTPVYATLLDLTQVIMLFAGSFLLARALGLTGKKRCLFMVLNWCSYPPLLFSLMMEQYVAAYFWLMLLLFLLSERPCSNRLAMCGVCGTMIPGMVLFPALPDISPTKQPSSWLNDTVKNILIFLAVILAFGRMDILLNSIASANHLSRFSTLDENVSVAFSDKLAQYTQFLRSCLTAPPAGPMLDDLPSWQMAAPSFTAWGVVILGLCALGAVLNREKPMARISALWLLMSAGMLLFIGWGTVENGLVLYTLYFGWAVLALLWLLVDALARRVGRPGLTAAVAAAGAAVLAAVNLPQLWAMVQFAVNHYPV